MLELQVGLDIGSTTAKVVVLNGENKILFKSYQRHFSNIKNTTLKLLKLVLEKFPNANNLKMNASGSSSMGISEQLGIPFIQEVVACTEAVKTAEPNIDVIVELGGEDAKLIYLTDGLEQRMNSACAGGTGAFIDEIAALLDTDAKGLNKLAAKAEKIYPIASRCGVFAKTDIQSFLNEGARKEDIAASVFQAVVNQTIGGLACGRPIKGNVAFLGGPLTFLDQLRYRFIKTLKLSDEQILYSDDGHYYVSIGAALESRNSQSINIQQVIDSLSNSKQLTDIATSKRMDPLFKSEHEYQIFQRRHEQAKVQVANLNQYKGNAYLGIDAGSTTTKIVLIGESEEILFSFYKNNRGNPTITAKEGLLQLYEVLPEGVHIVRSTVTGYGEKLIQAAFQIDDGEIETVAHYTAAKKFQPDVDFILDIGGQDMKCIQIKNGVIDQIMLNEACSAGCGSFLENFAESLGYNIQDFSKLALTAEGPVDLGSRCTVFMNSKVKQVQKEGASIADIAAGLSYSIVMNALYKVIKLKSIEQLGSRIVVQGGTFLNAAVLRAFEKLTKKEVIRPDLAGLMGAYGSALLAKQRATTGERSSILPVVKLHEFQVRTIQSRCGGCQNNCALTINRFPDKRMFITGNRCERGAGKQKVKRTMPNIIEEKLKKLFDRPSLTGEDAPRGKIGIPRVLNMFENYPFWHQFFTELGFEVVLSDPSNKKTFEKGIESIVSESVCYPAKLVHGHMMNLIKKGVKTIFYPAVVYEKYEDESQQNNFNCPVVASYPEVIRVNMGRIFEENDVQFISPFLTLANMRALAKELYQCFSNIPKQEIKNALKKAKLEKELYKRWLAERGEEIIAQLLANNQKGIVIAGHPYHIDPEVNHGLPEEINKLGLAVLTEDAVCHLVKGKKRRDVVNQWTYHSRLYRAADVVKETPQLELLQVVSFGCGIDAITTDTVKDILDEKGQLYTWIKVDEVSNLGAARIRIRSLKAAMEERSLLMKQNKQLISQTYAGEKGRLIKTHRSEPMFTKEHKNYTILAPQMSPTHFSLFEKALKLHGYNLKVMKDVNDYDVEEGLRYVNNDACYPAIITIGQLVAALKSGEYDPNNTAVIMSQTGGGCRATNYFSLLKKALKNAGMEQVPVISLNAAGLMKNTQPGFKITLSLARKLVIAACLGDLLQQLKLSVRPYEKIPGSTERLYKKWLHTCIRLLNHLPMRKYKHVIQSIIDDFKNIETVQVRKPQIGIVGEILVKFHPYANNKIIEIIENEGGEAIVPDLVDFFLYCLYNQTFKAKHLGQSIINAKAGKLGIRLIEIYRNPIRKALETSGHFAPPLKISEIARKASKFISLGNQMGEGWLLTGEMAGLMENGVRNVICVQPFGCLPNHIIGRGMFNAIKEEYSHANLISIDYDASISKVNQLNRIKLMVNIAKDNLNES